MTGNKEKMVFTVYFYSNSVTFYSNLSGNGTIFLNY